MWKILLTVFVGGAIGGLLNALLSGAGFILPRFAVVAGSKVLAPGFIGNVLIDAVAAFISYGLYGPVSSMAIVGGGQSQHGAPSASAQLTLAALAGAILVGFSGGRWMTAEADKQFNHGTAVAIAQLTKQLAASEGATTAMSVPPSRTPVVRYPAIESLLGSLQTGTPRESYEKALKLRGTTDGTEIKSK